MQQDGSGHFLSPDRRWTWNGETWVPNTALSFGDVISIPTRTPNWFSTCGLEGLIGLIPIYGSFEVLGWAVTFADNLRAGYPDLPPARFGYAGRGARPAVVALILSVLAFAIFYGAFIGLFVGMASTLPHCPTTGCPPGQASPPPIWFFPSVFGLEFLYFIFALMALGLVLPIIRRADRLGIGAGLNLVGAIRMVGRDWRTAGASLVLVFLAYFISGLGAYACFVGVVFSYGYAAAMLGAALRWHELREPSLEA